MGQYWSKARGKAMAVVRDDCEVASLDACVIACDGGPVHRITDHFSLLLAAGMIRNSFSLQFRLIQIIYNHHP
jgi:hypothetical protein